MFNRSNDKLESVPFNTLEEGTLIMEDVYSFDSRQLLVRSGTLLDAETLTRLKRRNQGHDYVYVSGNTYKTLMAKEAETRRITLENETGYAELTTETVSALKEISTTQTVERETMIDMSEELSNKLETTRTDTVLSLINALAPVDEYLQRHCINTGMLNGLMGKWLGMNKSAVDKLVLIGLLHDCGKALIPASILSAPRKLTHSEYTIIKTHTIKSYELLVDFPEFIRLAARGHHEKVDGTGYPDKLKGEQIPLEARITAVADIYDALVSQRAYKQPRSPFSVMAIIAELSGTELDSNLVNLFLRSMPQEIMDKKVMLSNGKTGIVRSFDVQNIEYPTVEIDGKIIATNKNLYCVSMC